MTKTTWFMSLCLLLLPALATAEPPGELESLLARAGASTDEAAARLERASFRERTRMEELDGDGKPKTVTLTEATVRRVDGKPLRTLVSATRDGKDVLEELRAKEEERKAKGKGKRGELKIESPFRSGEQARYRFTLLGGGEGATRKVGFEPKEGEDPEQTGRGEASLEAETGRVLRMTFAPAKLPRFVDRADTEVVFGPQGPKRMEIHAKGGFLFVRSRYHIVSEFSDYAWPPAEAK